MDAGYYGRERGSGRATIRAVAEWECAACGNVIGVYDPLVVVDRSGERQTSRAAEPQLQHIEGRCFHRHCHMLVFRDRGQPD